MNWTRLVLDAILLAIIFNLAAIATVAYNPRLMLPCYPKGIQSLAPPTAREKHLYHSGSLIGMLSLMIYACISMHAANVEGFHVLFGTFYLEWLFVSLSDFFLLDMGLMRKCTKRAMAAGTEGHPDYAFKNWMCKLALPEHLLMWPLLLCPMLAAIQAGALWLLSQM